MFFSINSSGQREWQDIFKVMKGRNLQPRVLYPARLLFRFNDEVKGFTDKQKQRSPLASTAGLGGGSCRPSFAGPQSRFSRWETDVRGHRWPFVLYVTSCLSTPTVSHPRGQPLAFQYPPTPQAALTSDSGESLAIMSPFSYCRIYRNLWQNGQEHGLCSHMGFYLTSSPAILPAL